MGRIIAIVVIAIVGVVGGLWAFAFNRYQAVLDIRAPWVHLGETTQNLDYIFRQETGVMMLGAWACPAPRCPTDARLLVGLDKTRSSPEPSGKIEKAMRTMVWQPAFSVPDSYQQLHANHNPNAPTVIVQTRSGIKFADVVVRVRNTPGGVAYYILQTREDNRVQAERMLDSVLPGKR
jgi:hypothetical protein